MKFSQIIAAVTAAAVAVNGSAVGARSPAVNAIENRNPVESYQTPETHHHGSHKPYHKSHKPWNMGTNYTHSGPYKPHNTSDIHKHDSDNVDAYERFCPTPVTFNIYNTEYKINVTYKVTVSNTWVTVYCGSCKIPSGPYYRHTPKNGAPYKTQTFQGPSSTIVPAHSHGTFPNPPYKNCSGVSTMCGTPTSPVVDSTDMPAAGEQSGKEGEAAQGGQGSSSVAPDAGSPSQGDASGADATSTPGSSSNGDGNNGADTTGAVAPGYTGLLTSGAVQNAVSKFATLAVIAVSFYVL